MSATATTPSSVVIPAYRIKDATLNWTLIVQLCICVFPAMACLTIKHPLWGARYLAGSLLAFLVYQFFRRDRYQFLTLVVGSMPALVLMRGVFFYNSILLFLGLGLLLWATLSKQETSFVWRDGTWKLLAALCTLYWWASFLMTGDYNVNIRLLEFLLASTSVYLLANRRSHLATAMVGMAISSSALALSLLPFAGDRLGMAMIGTMKIGNPVLLGVPSSLILLLSVADGGSYLLLENRQFARLIVWLAAGEALILSGSRGSWAVTLVGITLILVFGKQSKTPLLGFLGVLCLVSIVVLSTSRGELTATLFQKTISSERSLANRTSGRSEQWKALPEVFSESPIWGWGPGSAQEVDYIYTGRHLAWHSVYLQILGETGLLGFLPFLWFAGSLLRRTTAHLQRTGEITPLIGIVSYLVLGLTVSAFDSFAGILVGVAFLARDPISRFTADERLVAFAPEEQTATQSS